VDAHIKLSVVASDIFGVSGRAMLAALIAGERDPKVLAELARGRMRAKRSVLEEAFTGVFTGLHRGFQRPSRVPAGPDAGPGGWAGR
jgi:transposase